MKQTQKTPRSFKNNNNLLNQKQKNQFKTSAIIASHTQNNTKFITFFLDPIQQSHAKVKKKSK